MDQEINRVAVVGAGYMGTGILQVLALSGLHCTFADVDGPTAQAAHAACLDQASRFEGRGYFPAGSAERIEANSDWSSRIADAAADADLVIEAVSEREQVKRAVFAEVESAAREDAILATNTSSIPIADLAATLRRPERFYGIHWFNPAQFLPSIEIIEGPRASASTTQRIIDVLRRAGRSPVVVADSAGFVANRLQFALFREAALMVEEGLTTPEKLDEVVRGSFGYRLPFFGPFAIADLAGLDVYAAVFEVLERTLGPRFSCPPGLSALVDDGHLGVKTGHGYAEFTEAERERMTDDRDRAYVAMAATLGSWRGSETPS
ncbi:MAG: 3-hydroxybutyryl-CoA dehydrogenase [Pseudonocardiales bacterium]|nr:3-hydroxybutyryl-CoA dehydrogenase [Pseudonocardiales bacterium]